ncbi:cytochrome P450 94B3 [Typha angustifolia]|uniref:cytochrome P450 94B3 n=1 Tax=Typha angustifolia TaxID=59011 RepID=UPI003C2B0474
MTTMPFSFFSFFSFSSFRTSSFSFFSSLPSIGLLFCFLLSFFILLHYFVTRILTTFSYSNNSYGPKMHPVVGCFVSFYQNRRRLLDWYTSLLAESPTMTIVVSRIGACRTVVTADPANVEYILKSNFSNYPKGRPFTELLGDFLGSGIFNADGELWLSQRKLASHEFTTRSLKDFAVVAVAAETADRLVPVLTSAGLAGRVVDMQDLLKRFAFDTISRISLGVDPGFLSPSLPASELADAFETASAICAGRGSAPISLIWKVKRFLRIGSEKRLHEAINLIRESITRIVRLRRAQEEEGGVAGDGTDLLSRLISAGHSEEVIRDMAISFVVAGRDTTSAALTWFFYMMTCHPEAEAAVVEEVRRINKGKERLDYHALKEMKVLEACLCETMRLYPPVAWDSKYAVADDVLPDGTWVRGGDRVTYFPYGMGRMERLWGEKWMRFDYKRWLTAEGEVARVSPFKFAVFQAGPRVCLGKEMAFLQMKYIAAAVVGKFRLRPAAGEGGPAPVFVPQLTAHMAGGLRVAVEEREVETLNPTLL